MSQSVIPSQRYCPPLVRFLCRFSLVLLFLPALLLVMGCGGKGGAKDSVSGKVVFKGQPVEGSITFIGANGKEASAPIMSDGTYMVPDPPLGEDKIVIKGAPGMSNAPARKIPAMPGKDVTPVAKGTPPPARYAVPTNGLTFKVTGGKQTYDVRTDAVSDCSEISPLPAFEEERFGDARRTSLRGSDALRSRGRYPGSPPVEAGSDFHSPECLETPMRACGRRMRIFLVLLVLLILGLTAYPVGLRCWGSYHQRAAEQALERRDFQQASKHLQECLNVWPDDPTVRLLAARAARRQGNYGQALEHLRVCRQKKGLPNATELEYQLIRVQKGDLAEADRLLSFCVDHPKEAETPLILEALLERSLKVLSPAASLGLTADGGVAAPYLGSAAAGRWAVASTVPRSGRSGSGSGVARPPVRLRERLRES